MARPGLISRLDPGCRLLCLALLSSAFFFLEVIPSSISFIALFLLAMGEGLSPLRLFRDCAWIAGMAAFLVIVYCVGYDPGHGFSFLATGLWNVARYASRLASAFMAGRIFYATTPGSALREAALKAGVIFPRRMRAEVALALVLVLGYIPRIAMEWKATEDAARSRGIAKKPGILAGARLLSALMTRLMVDSVLLPEVLSSRAWSGQKPPEVHGAQRWSLLDFLAAALAGAFLLAAITTRKGPSLGPSALF